MLLKSSIAGLTSFSWAASFPPRLLRAICRLIGGKFWSYCNRLQGRILSRACNCQTLWFSAVLDCPADEEAELLQRLHDYYYYYEMQFIWALIFVALEDDYDLAGGDARIFIISSCVSTGIFQYLLFRQHSFMLCFTVAIITKSYVEVKSLQSFPHYY